MTTFEHEEVHVHSGRRSGLPIVVAIHSTVLGQAIGGVRMWHYPDWGAGLADALKLARGMTYKSAVAGLANGGGKTVIVLPEQGETDRRAALLDVGDIVESLGGRYAVGPDVGTGEDDMVTIAERTAYVFCQPAERGGSGDSSPHTAVGVLAALHATCAHLFGPAEFSRRRFAVIGLGRVGGAVAESLSNAGAHLILADVAPDKRGLAERLGATWAEPADALTADVDLLVPAALGGMLTAELVPALRCRAIAGPANNQLAEDKVADLLFERDIAWVPDYVVSAGGIVNAIARELDGHTPEEATERVNRIGDTVGQVLQAARERNMTPAQAARELAEQRLASRKFHGPTA